MKTTLDCIPCFLRQSLALARFVTEDRHIHERIMRRVLAEIADIDLQLCPPQVASHVHRSLKELTGTDDPYRDIKRSFNKMVLNMMPVLKEQVRNAENPYAMALRLAIAGNVIDVGAHSSITETEAVKALQNTMSDPFAGDAEHFIERCSRAESILYLADNAGEIVLDRLLLEHMPVDRTVVAVRGAPVLNDATMEDARYVGLCDMVRVIDNGSDVPGTVYEVCSPRFQQEFDRADLIISKGQGNFETLSDCDRDIYFLFKVKCPVVSCRAGIPEGTHVALYRAAGGG